MEGGRDKRENRLQNGKHIGQLEKDEASSHGEKYIEKNIESYS